MSPEIIHRIVDDVFGPPPAGAKDETPGMRWPRLGDLLKAYLGSTSEVVTGDFTRSVYRQLNTVLYRDLLDRFMEGHDLSTSACQRALKIVETNDVAAVERWYGGLFSRHPNLDDVLRAAMKHVGDVLRAENVTYEDDWEVAGEVTKLVLAAMATSLYEDAVSPQAEDEVELADSDLEPLDDTDYANVFCFGGQK